MVFEASQADFQQSESLVLAKVRLYIFFCVWGRPLVHSLTCSIAISSLSIRCGDRLQARRIIIAP